MRLNDRVLTVLTGVVLAAGAGAAALLLGDHGKRPEVVVAALEPSPAEPPGAALVLSDTSPRDLAAAAAPAGEAPGAPAPSEAPRDGAIVLASLEPEAARAPAREVAPEVLQLSTAALPRIGEIRDIVLTRAAPEAPPPRAPRLAAVLPDAPDGLQRIALPLQKITDCGLEVRVSRLTGARLRLRLEAPCHPGVPVTIEHAGLRFKERLDAQGRLSLKVPVFEEYARFDIRLPDGTATTVGAFVADLSRLERVGIAFSGSDDTFLHAMEPGATWDGPGHVWRLRPRSRAEAVIEGGGYMTLLGDPNLPDPELAQVFSMPRGKVAPPSPVEISVETLRDACGAPVSITLARLADGAPLLRTLTTTRAGCGGEASHVLKETLKPITLAQH